MSTNHEVLSEIGERLKAFLVANGGMSNDYETFISGEVKVDSGGYLDWFTPKAWDMTHRDIRSKGRLIYSAIKGILDNNGLKSCKIERGKYREWEIVVSVQYSLKFSIL